MATYAFLDAPQPYDLTSEKAKQSFLKSLRDSRSSVISGAFLTKANVVAGTLQPLGHLNLCIGIHQFPGTLVARATVTINVRQTIPQPASSAPNGSAAIKNNTIIKSVNVPELVFGFKENPSVYFVVPRDSTLEKPEPNHHLYTFLTLRNQPGGTTLEHQVIPVTFESTLESDRIVDVMRAHINKYNEVKDKMANAFRHIPKMKVKYLDLTEETINAMQTSLPAEAPKDDDNRKRARAPRDDAQNSTKKPRKTRVKSEGQSETSPATAMIKPKKERKTKQSRADDSPASIKAGKQKKASIIPFGWKCEICGTTSTVMRRRGPSGLNCACNSCGQAWASANRAKPKVEAPSDYPVTQDV